MNEYITSQYSWLNSFFNVVLLSNTDALETGGSFVRAESDYLLSASGYRWTCLDMESASKLVIGGNFADGNIVFNGSNEQQLVSCVDFNISGGSLYITAQSGALSEDSKAQDKDVLLTISNTYTSIVEKFHVGETRAVQDVGAYIYNIYGVFNVDGALSGQHAASSLDSKVSHVIEFDDSGNDVRVDQMNSNNFVAGTFYMNNVYTDNGELLIVNDMTLNGDLTAEINNEVSAMVLTPQVGSGTATATMNGNTAAAYGFILEQGGIVLNDTKVTDSVLRLDKGNWGGSITNYVHNVAISFTVGNGFSGGDASWDGGEEPVEPEKPVEPIIPGGGKPGNSPLGEASDEGEGEGEGEGEKDVPVTPDAIIFSGNKVLAITAVADVVSIKNFDGKILNKIENIVFEASSKGGGERSTTITNNIIEANTFDARDLTFSKTFTGEIEASIDHTTISYFDGAGYRYASGNEIGAYGIKLRTGGTFTAKNNFAGAITLYNGNSDMSPANMLYNSAQYNYSSYTFGIKAATINVAGGLNTDINIKVENVLNSSKYSASCGVYADNFNAQYVGANIKIECVTEEAGGTPRRNVGLWLDDKITNGNDNVLDIIGNISVSGGLADLAIMGGKVSGLQLRISGSVTSDGYAIYAGELNEELSNVRYNTNDNITIAAGATVVGNIQLFNGDNNLTIDSNARYAGMVESTLGALNLTFVLNGKTFTGELADISEAIFTVSPYENTDYTLLSSTTTISIDLNDCEVGKEYVLFEGEQLNFDKWARREIAVCYQGRTISMVLGQTYKDDSMSLKTNISDDGRITFTVEDLKPETYAPVKGVSTWLYKNDTTKESYIVLDWAGTAATSYYVLEYSIDGGKTVEVQISGKEEEFHLTNVDQGSKVSWRIRKLSTTNKLSEWSDVHNFEVAVDGSSIKNLGNTSYINQGTAETGTSVVNVSWSTPESIYDIESYEVWYVTNPKNEAPNWDDPSLTFASKKVTGNFALISGLNNMDYVFWRVRAIDSNDGVSDWSYGDTLRVYVGDTTAPEFDVTSVTTVVSFDATKPMDSIMNVSISWKPAVDVDGKSGVAGYEISYRKVNEKGEAIGDWITVRTGADATSWSGSMANGLYEWKINVSDYAGNKSKDYSGSLWRGDYIAPIFQYGANLEADVVLSGKGNNNITLTWNAASDTATDLVYQSGMKGYTLYYKIDGMDDSKAIKVELGKNAVSYNFSSMKQELTDGKYKWWLAAEDNAGNKLTTDQSDFSVDTTAPTGGLNSNVFPPKITATLATVIKINNNGVSYAVTTATNVKVTFSLPGNYEDANDIYYVVQFCGNDLFSENVYEIEVPYIEGNTEFTLGGTDFKYSAGALAKMGTVYWRVAAKDSIGNQTAQWYQESAFKMETADGIKLEDNEAPQKVKTLNATTAGEKITFTWSGATDEFGIKHYELMFVGVDGTKGSFTISNIEEAKYVSSTLKEGTYKWKVAAVDWSGLKSDWSSSADIIIDITNPEFNTDSVKASVLNRDICITWDAATDNVKVEEYEVRYSTWDAVAGGYVAWMSTHVNAKTLNLWLNNRSDGSLAYQVRALDSKGNASDWSETQYITVDTNDDPGSTFATAKQAVWDVEYDQVIGRSDTVDMYKYTLASAGQVTFTISDVLGEIVARSGVKVALFNAAGKQLKSISVSGKSKDKTISLLLDITSGGDYYLKVTPGGSNSGKNLADYTVSGEVDYFPEATGNNSLAKAEKVVLDGNGAATLTGWVGFGNASQYYMLDAAGAGEVTVTISGLDSKAAVALYDANGKRIKSLSVSGDKVVFNRQLIAGDFYLSVTSGDNGKGKYNTDYTVTVSDKYFPEPSENGTFETAAKVALNPLGSAGFTGWVGYGDAVDYYEIQAMAAGEFSLSIADLDTKVTVTLFDANGKKIKSASVKDDKVVFSNLLVSGKVYVSITSGDKGKGKYNTDYTVTVTDKYFPAATNDNIFDTANVLNFVDGVAAVKDGWVGFGDAYDTYKIAASNASMLNLSISGLTSQVTVTLFDANGKKIKNVNVKKDGLVFTDLLLTGNVSYIQIGSGDKGKGKYNTNYQLEITDELLPAASENNSFASAFELDFSDDKLASASDWVGYGDTKDYYKFEVAADGSVALDLDYDDNSLKLGSQIKLNMYDEAGKRLSLKNYSCDVTAGVYYVAVEISDGKKYNTNYDLDIKLA